MAFVDKQKLKHKKVHTMSVNLKSDYIKEKKDKKTEKNSKNDLSCINKMVMNKAAKLSAANKKLQQEVIECKKAEKKLKGLNHQLKSGKTELLMVNEQLKAKIRRLIESEKMLSEREEGFRSIVETANDAIMTVNTIGKVVFWNKGAETIFGYKEKDILNRSVLNLIPHRYKSVHKNGLKKTSVIGHMDQKTVEAYGLRKNGSEFPMESSRYSWNIGNKIFHTIIVRDITSRKCTEDKLIKLNKELKASEQELRATNQQLKAGNIDLMESEAALKKSEKKYRQLVESMNDGVIVGDKKGLFAYVNDRICKMIGYNRDEIIGESATKFMDEKNKKILIGELAERRKGIYNAYEIELIHKNGEKISVIISPKPIFDENKAYLGSLAVVTDITNIKQAEQKIRESRDFLENIFKTTGDGIIVTDSRGYLVRVNKATATMLGFSEEDLIGKHTAELLAGKDDLTNFNFDMMTKLREQGYVENYETVWSKKDGGVCPVEINITLLKDDCGNTTGSVTVVRNITERKKAEKVLKETKDFLESVIESSRDGILFCDEMGNIISANSALEQMCIFTKEDLRGKHASELLVKDENTIKNIIEKTAVLFEKGFTTYEAKYKNKEDKIIDVECISSMVKDENGNYIAGISIIRDISDRRKMEYQLLQSEKLRSLGELAGGVAHDFNNVLAAVLGRAQLMKKLIASPVDNLERGKALNEIIKGLETIENAALDGAETVRRIQEFSRKRKEDRDLGIADLTNIIDGAVELTKVRWKNGAEANGISYKVSKELSSLPLIKGSASELREVFINLINNALDAMPDGGEIKITAYVCNNYVVVNVSDTGTGITQNIMDRIFDPFFTTKGPKSTGLGMSVSYGIINRHNGSIKVRNNEDKGATFIIKLPLAEKRKKKEVNHLSTHISKKISILIAEDEKGVRELLRDLLICEGHNVKDARDGSEAIALFKESNFDVVFTDLGMPGISGWKVAEEIKKMDKNTPVVLVTGWEIMHSKEEISKNGVDIVINKPFRMDQILQAVKQGIELREKTKGSNLPNLH